MISRISLLEGRVKDPNTDSLYEPLRKTLLEDTTNKKDLFQTTAKVSKITRLSRVNTSRQNQKIALTTLIPQNAKLKRCYDLSKIPKNKKYCIVNVIERQLDPISSSQLEQRLKYQDEQEIIVYTYGDDDNIEEFQSQEEVIAQLHAKPNNFSSQEEVVAQLHAKPNKSYEFKALPKKQEKKKQPKYNLFSLIDQGINNLLGGKSCTCPANEIIAERPTEITWDFEEKQ